MYLYIIIWILILTSLYWIMLFLLERKITSFEKEINNVFGQRSNLIPSIFEVSKHSIVKHKEIFEEILKLRKINFAENNIWTSLPQFLKTQTLIHSELNFIFRICNKHNKLLKDGKFIYIRDLIIDKSFDIWTRLELYKKIVRQYNKLIIIKQVSIIGLLLPFSKKQTI